MKIYKAGLIGCGYWGKNLLRNFYSNNRVEIHGVCDRNPENLVYATTLDDSLMCYKEAEVLLLDKSIEIIIISTQASTHFELTKRALEQGKHVFVEKPFVMSSQEAMLIMQLAKSKGLTVMVDHTFLFTPEYQQVKKIIHSNRLGRPLHYHSTRGDFGLFQKDVNVLWHLFYHDAYLFLDLFCNEKLIDIKASLVSHIIPGIEDTGIVHIKAESGLSADFIFNMLWPKKERKIIVAGSENILLWDDVAKDKLSIYGKSALYDFDTRMVNYSNSGETEVIGTEYSEALTQEIEYFIECLDKNIEPLNDSSTAYKVVKFIEKISDTVRLEKL